MFAGAGAHIAMSKLMRKVRRIIGDKRGVAAIEFALIVPLLLCMYFVTMEVAQGVETNKKVSRVGSLVADLVTQQMTIQKADLDAIMKIGGSVLEPYERSSPKIVVTAIEITDETTPKVKVFWSRKLENGVYSVDAAKGTATTVPAALNVRNSFLVRVESYLTYKPVITWAAANKKAMGLTAAFDSINMRETYYLRPRRSLQIPCGDC